MWSRNRIMSDYAAGGHYTWGIDFFGGKIVSNPQAYHANYTAYYLGARVETFASPSLKYLSWDAEAGNDYANSQGTNTITLRSDVNRPPWSGPGGSWAFRHNLPTDVALYQKQARGMALYVDGHAQKMNPNDAVYQSSHFVANP
jgi:hypothetical protein